MSRPSVRGRVPRSARPAVGGVRRRSAGGALLKGAARRRRALGCRPARRLRRATAASSARSRRRGSTGTRHARLQRLRRRAEGGLRRRASPRSRRPTPASTVKVNTVDHNTFQENINNYLQGNPDDVFTWFAGYRMRFFAAQGLAGDISDVWDKLDASFTDAFKQASTGDDGKQYFVPFYNYPWAVFYRKSVFEEKGYAVPKTLDEFDDARRKQMKKDGLTRSPSPTRTAGRRWAPSTSSTCGSTATSSTST